MNGQHEQHRMDSMHFGVMECFRGMRLGRLTFCAQPRNTPESSGSKTSLIICML
jgi:hypothetical protein